MMVSSLLHVLENGTYEEKNEGRKEGRKEGMKHWLEEPMPREQDRRNEEGRR
jgi:hypothetical protein